MTEACENCRFWEQWTTDDDSTPLGYCRRHAPTPGKEPDEEASFWPNTFSEDWCGEYQPVNTEHKP